MDVILREPIRLKLRSSVVLDLPMLILCVRFQPGRLLIRVRSCEAGDCMTDEESEAVVAAFAPSRRRVSSGPCAA